MSFFVCFISVGFPSVMGILGVTGGLLTTLVVLTFPMVISIKLSD